MASAPARFRFDLDLGSKAPAPVNALPEDAVQTMLAEARASAYAEGLAEGGRSAAAASAQRLAEAAQGLAARVGALTSAFDAARQDNEAQCVDLAASIARKLACHLLAREPAAELEALLAECMGFLDGVPHLVIRCHPDLALPLREIAEREAQVHGFSGRLVVMGDPDQRLGDGRIEWVDGGLIRDISAISAEVDAAIAAYMAARRTKRSTEAR